MPRPGAVETQIFCCQNLLSFFDCCCVGAICGFVLRRFTVHTFSLLVRTSAVFSLVYCLQIRLSLFLKDSWGFSTLNSRVSVRPLSQGFDQISKLPVLPIIIQLYAV